MMKYGFWIVVPLGTWMGDVNISLNWSKRSLLKGLFLETMENMKLRELVHQPFDWNQEVMYQLTTFYMFLIWRTTCCLFNLLNKNDASFESSKFIVVWVGALYCLLGHLIQGLLHNTTNICELVHQSYTHIHYKALLSLQYFAKWVLEINIEHVGVCKGFPLGKC